MTDPPRKAGLRGRRNLSIRVALGLVLLSGVGFGALRLWIDSYRSEWLAEQRAIAAIRAQCPGCGFTIERIGPRWLIWLAGPARAREFDRVTLIICAACDVQTAPFKSFRHVGGAINL